MRTKTNLLFLLFISLTSCSKKSNEEQLNEWISDHAAEITTVEPGNGFEDLIPFGEMVDDARIVSLGEPTHGNKEVFQLKHRMIEYLVTELDFNILTLECPFAEAFDINRYVLDGIGDPRKALAGIYFWTWDTEEVLALIEWMRAYNANPKNDRKVKFYGFDPQDPQRAARVTLEYLEKVDIELEQIVRPELGILEVPFSDPIGMGRRHWIPEEYDASSLKQIKRVLEAFESKKESYVSSTDLEEWEIAKQHARQVEIYIKSSINEAADYSYQRDLGQAENIKWALDFEGEDSKIIVWAHNIHINNGFVPEVEKEGERFLYTEMMGNHLKNWYQDKVRIVGFFFNQGQFTALDNEIPSQGMAVFNVEEAKNGSLENRLIEAGLSNAFLDLSQVPSKGLVHDWINEPIPTRYSWGSFKATKAEDFYWTHTLGSEFDAIVFLDKTTATVPIDSADYENVWLLDKKLSHPTNLDFEENEVGEAPNGWITWSKFERLGVTMTTSDQAHQGNKSLMIHRPKDLAYGEIGPNVVQQISAQPFLGKRIRFTATAKSELDNSTFALIHLKVDADFDDNVHSGEPSLFDSLDNYRIKHSEWTLYTIEAEVPENAHSITYSVHLRDFGTVWLDDVKIEIIE